MYYKMLSAHLILAGMNAGWPFYLAGSGLQIADVFFLVAKNCAYNWLVQVA